MLASLALELAERGLVADTLLRYGIRRWLRTRLRSLARSRSSTELAVAMRAGPVVPRPSTGPERRKEVSAAFFEQVLGPHLKYSCAYWPESIETLADAEAAMLALTCERAGLADGQRVLELGCGWGSLSLWMARRYPASRIVAVSPSHTHRAFIETRRPSNLEVITADLDEFETGRRFDRVVSVETLERLWNWEPLLSRIAAWLELTGALLVQLVVHARHAYSLDADGLPTWMGGGCFAPCIMPSTDLIDQFRRHLSVEERWVVGGEHYARTAEAWRVNLDARREWVLPILTDCYGQDMASRWYHRWRLFFVASAELFGYHGGSEWGLAQYLLRRP